MSRDTIAFLGIPCHVSLTEESSSTKKWRFPRIRS